MIKIADSNPPRRLPKLRPHHKISSLIDDWCNHILCSSFWGNDIPKILHGVSLVALLDVCDDKEALLSRYQCALNRCKVLVYSDKATGVEIWPCQLHEHLSHPPKIFCIVDFVSHFVLRIVSCVASEAFYSMALFANLQSEHDCRRNFGKIVDLTTVVWLMLERQIHWQSCINIGTPDVVPADDWCGSSSRQSPWPTSTSTAPIACLLWLHRWLMRPPDIVPGVIEAVVCHVRLAQVVRREVLGGSAAALPEHAAGALYQYHSTLYTLRPRTHNKDPTIHNTTKIPKTQTTWPPPPQE